MSCQAYDALGNAIPQPSGVSLVLPPEISLDPPTGSGFIIRGTALGSFDVACRVDTVMDTLPETLTVLTGLPGASNTMVSATSVFPGDTVSVACDVTDNFGNPVDVQTTLVVLSAKDSSQEEAGIQHDDTSFSATEAGIYYVACAVPGFLAADDTPAEVRVWPGPPASWDVSLPSQDCFWEDRGLPFLFAIYDAWGNAINLEDLQSHGPPEFDTVSLLVSSTPAGAILAANGTVRVSGEGIFDLSVELVTNDPSFTDPMSTLTPFATSVMIDSTPPTFTSMTPSRGEMLLQGDVNNSTVGISGTVADSINPILDITILGERQSVGGAVLSEDFSTSHTSRWGLNIVTGSATDECGNTRIIAQSYLRSGAYFDAADTPCEGTAAACTSARADRGIHAHLNQNVIDDGDRSDLDDLASIGETIVSDADFNAMLTPGQVLASDPNEGCFDTGYTVRRDDDSNRRITIAPIEIQHLEAIHGGLSFQIAIPKPASGPGVSVPLEAQGCVTAFCGTGCTGFIGFQVGADSVSASGTLNVSSTDGVVNANVTSISLNTHGIFADPDCGILDFVCDPISATVVPLLEVVIENALGQVVQDQLDPLVEEFLGSFGLATSFTIPAPLETTVAISSAIDFAQFLGETSPNAHDGFASLGLSTQIYPPSIYPAHVGARGPIRKDGTVPSFARGPYDFGLGLKEDMLNQIFHAVWYGGALNLPDLTDFVAELGIEGVALSFDATLPPVVMPGVDNQFDIGIGDAFISAHVDLGRALGDNSTGTINLGMYLSAIVGGNLGVDDTGVDTTFTVDLDPAPAVYVEITHLDDEGYQAPMTQLFNTILQLLLPELLGRALGAFPIPAFDVGGLAGFPLGSELRIDPTEVDRPAVGDYFRMTGGVRVTSP